MSGFYRGQAVNGFTFVLINKTNGGVIDDSGDPPAVYVTLDDGAQAAATNAPAYKGNGQWSIDFEAAEFDAALVGLLFTHADAVPVNINIKTAPPVDGISREVFDQVLLAFVAPGRTVLANNGDGTKKLTMYARDDATKRLAVTFDASGQWTDVEINPA